MNPLHEFIFIASGITVIFTVVIIGLIVSNSKNKKRLKTSNDKEKFTEKDVLEIKTRYFKGERIRDIVKDYNVSFQTISCIVYNKTWKHISLTGEELI